MIGLALSGGGSRAIAFHLGCLRALHDRGLLKRIRVISGVSGGAVIAAMYAYSEGDFQRFDKRVIVMLRAGFNATILRQFFAPQLFLRLLATNLISRPIAFCARRLGYQPPLRRWASRTDAFEGALQKLYGDLTLPSPRRENMDVVINACELRSGTAFRFGSRHSGSWRTEETINNNISVAHAVAASAAYPLFLPALDRNYQFKTAEGVRNRRVVLSDGGVYDNLGTTCMEPGRSSEFSLNVFEPDYILACYAGHGQFDDALIPFGFFSRMERALDTTFRKTQDATMKRLHEYVQSGKLRGFILPYLGQQDSRLPARPPDLVAREAVVSYPTNFSSMNSERIKALSLRGEQLTRLLLSHYCPEL